jgi:two-component system, sensor histidine kinase and response regulator
LLDVQMPEVDGLKAARLIRQREQGTASHLPLIAVTAHALVGDRERCLAEGMDDYIAKPLRRADIEAALRRICIRRGDSSVATLKEAFEGDAQLAARVAGVFLQTTPDLAQKLEDAIERQDFDLIQRYAHTLRGSLSQLHATTLEEHARTIESAGLEKKIVPAQQAMVRLKSELDLLCLRLKAFCDAGDP